MLQGELGQQATERARLVGPLREALAGLRAAKQAEERAGRENRALRESSAQLRAAQVGRGSCLPSGTPSVRVCPVRQGVLRSAVHARQPLSRMPGRLPGRLAAQPDRPSATAEQDQVPGTALDRPCAAVQERLQAKLTHRAGKLAEAQDRLREADARLRTARADAELARHAAALEATGVQQQLSQCACASGGQQTCVSHGCCVHQPASTKPACCRKRSRRGVLPAHLQSSMAAQSAVPQGPSWLRECARGCHAAQSGEHLRCARRQQSMTADLQQQLRNAQAPHEHLVDHVRALEERVAEQQAALQAARQAADQLARQAWLVGSMRTAPCLQGQSPRAVQAMSASLADRPSPRRALVCHCTVMEFPLLCSSTRPLLCSPTWTRMSCREQEAVAKLQQDLLGLSADMAAGAAAVQAAEERAAGTQRACEAITARLQAAEQAVQQQQVGTPPRP